MCVRVHQGREDRRLCSLPDPVWILKPRAQAYSLYSVSLSSGIFSRLTALNLTVDSFLSLAWTPPLKSISI